GYSGFSITFLVSLAVAFSLYLLSNNIQKTKPLDIGVIVSLLFLLIGNSFYGRVGLFNSLALIGFSIVYIFYKSKKVQYPIYLFAVLILLFVLVTVLRNFNDSLDSWYNWIMDPIINLITTGELNTTSTDSLRNMYFLPSWKTLLFGD